MEDGSFYDEAGDYFNKWGYDCEGGRYDEFGEHILTPNRDG